MFFENESCFVQMVFVLFFSFFVLLIELFHCSIFIAGFYCLFLLENIQQKPAKTNPSKSSNKKSTNQIQHIPTFSNVGKYKKKKQQIPTK